MHYHEYPRVEAVRQLLQFAALCMIRQATNYQTWEKETFKKVFEQFIKA